MVLRTSSQNYLILASYASHMLANMHLTDARDLSKRFDPVVNEQQKAALAKQARQALAEIDADFPGMIPVPHDGVEWRNRSERIE